MSEETAGHGGVDYERQDVNPKKILIVTFSLVAFIVVMIIFLSEVFTFEKEQQIRNVVLKPESAQIRDMRAADIQVLTGYKIIDPGKGVYQIPVERAMKLMVDEAYLEAQSKK
ncbi:MAG: hypothetical protein KDC45_12300 [Bacteroidetes bacterium]|nr:hypothetical protein [Bacteroidota bacterium]